MKHLPILMSLLLSSAAACSSGKEPPDRYNTVTRPVSPSPTAPAYLSSTRGTRSLISPKRQFVIYIPAAQRLSVMDQATESEAYSIPYAGPILSAFPIASFDGIAGLNAYGLTIFSGGAQRNFAFPFAGLAWDSAFNAPAFAFMTDNGVEMIRYLEGDQWQHETLPGLSTAGADIPLLSFDGLHLLVIRPSNGHYASYRASLANTPVSPVQSCDSEAPLERPLVALVTQEKRLLWANQRGELGILDMDADGCQSLTPLITLPDGQEIARILPRHRTSFLIFTIGGRVYHWDGASTLESFTTLDDCEFALATVALPDDDLVALCLNDLAQPVATDAIRYRRASFRYFRKSRPGVQIAEVTALDNLDRVAVDPPSKRIFFFDLGALGRFTAIDLATNQSRERKGVFVKNILNR